MPQPLTLDKTVSATALAVTAAISLALSAALLVSLADSVAAWWLLAGIALVMEAGKLLALVTRTRLARLLAALLVCVSVAGSVGGLARAIGESGTGRSQALSEIRSIDRQLAAIESAMGTNTAAIDRYIAMDRIAANARPLMADNDALRTQLAGLSAQRAAVHVPGATAMSALLSSLSTVTGLSTDAVVLTVTLPLALLLDLLALFFLQVLREGAGQPPVHRSVPSGVAESAVVTNNGEPANNARTGHNIVTLSHSYGAFKQAILKGELPLSQRGCIREGWPERKVRAWFKRLETERLLCKEKKRYRIADAIPQQRLISL